MIDANSNLADRDLHQFVANTNLLNIIHQDDLQPPTRWPGTKCINFVFGTTRVASSIKAVGYLPWKSPFTSDHLVLYIDFAKDHLFGSNTLDPAHPNQRQLKSLAPKQCKLYLKALDKHCRANSLLNRITKLYEKCLRRTVKV